MMRMDKNVYNMLADALEYPTPEIAGRAEACALALASVNGNAQDHFEPFLKFCTTVPVSRIEELYTDTFDLQALCCPYVGFHLFGEDRGRGMFMVRLKEHYRAENHQVNGELPDHISVMLRFLSDRERSSENMDLISYCIIPAMKKMISLFKDGANPYRGVLDAALMLLETEKGRS
jgi:nitrate reductase molybdenum cofactor assembly chaperone NarJ/NarW